jgi:N-acetylglucosaminyl-diphospho-decaprenol L-rhamnosyltransferase
MPWRQCPRSVQQTPPRIDAVIVSYNSADTLRDCVQSLLATPGVAVTVVDNASPDDSLGVIADLPVRTIQSGRNGGFGFGCNIGLRAGSAPLVLFLNPDARLDEGALDSMESALVADPGVGLLAPRLVDGDGALMASQRHFPRAATAWSHALFLHRLFPRARWADEVIRRWEEYERPNEPDWVSGACMLARRSVLEAIGGFDERFFLYCEDTDLCARIRGAGHRIRYDPSASAHHVGGHSAPRSGLYSVLADSRVRYARKHGGRTDFLLQAGGIALHALTHAAVCVLRPAHAHGHVAALRTVLRNRGQDLPVPVPRSVSP